MMKRLLTGEELIKLLNFRETEEVTLEDSLSRYGEITEHVPKKWNIERDGND